MTYRRKEIIGNCTLYLGDCLDILPLLSVHGALVTDPPYGIGMDGGNVGYKGFNDFEKKDWDHAPPSEDALNLLLSSASQHIIWGGNYFNLPPARCFLIWDKGAGFKNRTYAECEQAWTSLDANARVFEYDPLARGDYKGKFHPTQKPVSLMKWCLSFVEGRIIDPYMGSGSTLVAAAKLGRPATGIERDSQYFDIACKRIDEAYKQPDMFIPQPEKVKQEVLF